MEKKEQIKNIILVFSTIMKSMINPSFKITNPEGCLLYTSDAADE